MFKNLFSKKNENGTGVFKVEDKSLIELSEMPGNGSINSIIGSLGYPTNLIHTVHTFNSKKIDCIGFKILSKELVFVLAKDKQTKLSYSDVSKEVNQIDWDFEYSSLNVEDILNDGIDLENITLEFFKSVVNDLLCENQQTYQSKRLGLYFSFENDILKAFTSTGWDNSATKWLKDLNPHMFEEMLEEASLYHDNEIDAMEEVNKHCESLLNIPQAMQNEFIESHRKQNGNINLYNLLITHYSQNCNLNDFQFMNKGRYSKVGKSNFAVGKFVYEFGDLNQLIEVYSL